MADPPPALDTGDDTGDDTGVGHDRESTSGTPRWVKVSGIIALVLVTLFIVLLLTGNHGPGRHSSDGGGGATPLSAAKERGA